jgi:uncharacterized protein
VSTPLTGGSPVLEIPIFPLPNVVLFPRTILPLHIFEQRYRALVADALEGNRRVGMVLLRSGWERSPLGEADLHAVGGLGQISQFQKRDDGKFDVVLSGVGRFRIIELVSETPYRRAKVELLEDHYRERPEDAAAALRLVTRFRELMGLEHMAVEDREVLEKADLMTLVNSVCSALPISPHDKQTLLEIDDVRVRAEAVKAVVSQMLSQKRFLDQFVHLRPDEPGWN